MVLAWNCAGCLPMLAILLLYLVSPTSSGQHSTLCYSCHEGMASPKECTHVHKCGGNQMCHAEVYEDPPGHFTYYLGCMEENQCPVNPGTAAIVGRKRANNHPDNHPPHHHHHQEHLRCSMCCKDGTPCNRNLCSNFAKPAINTINATSTQPSITAVQPTASTYQAPVASTAILPPAAAYDPNCVDHEEDGITCITLNLFHLCTDTSPFAYVIAHEKCKKWCGFCKADPNAPTKAPGSPPNNAVCTDYEQDGFKCASMDLFSFCTDSSSLAYVLAHEKCRKHCGVCTLSGSSVPSTLSPTTQAATAQTATVLSTAAASTQQTTAAATQPYTSHNNDTYAPAMVTVVATQQPPVVISTGAPCVDVEENGFSCAYMDAFNICNTTEPMFSTLAHEKCSKHCGLC